MLVYIMLKPGYDTYDNIVSLVENYANKENGCEMVMYGRGQYTKKQAEAHYENLKGKDVYKDVANYLASGPVYGIVVNFDGTEEDWKQKRLSLIGATKNPAPGSYRYDATIGRGLPYPTLKNVIHSSDSYEAATKEIGIFLDVLENSIKKKAENPETYSTADDAISRLHSFQLDTETRNLFYKAIEEQVNKTNAELSTIEEEELNNGLTQYGKVSKMAKKTLKNLESTKEKVKYQYEK